MAEQNLTEISATYKKGEEDRECTVLYDFGGSVEAAVEKFGADVVYSNFVRQSKVSAQAIMRKEMENGASDEDVQAKLEAWKPGVQLERTVDPVKALLNKFGSLSPEAQSQLIANLQAKVSK